MKYAINVSQRLTLLLLIAPLLAGCFATTRVARAPTVKVGNGPQMLPGHANKNWPDVSPDYMKYQDPRYNRAMQDGG